ncbi:hypothetical protein H6S82_05515 [Planktothrix sp. FACHB-1355]|uniref:Uncharacterized protein n=1 Tax=Aerosakkonema funiforme FACHB-1375 TaxID=2949571 RepID=A0A926VB76_9CYAN|nr:MULTISPECIES: hypothetical protein [Oscillatoriales]MBD2180617.1 hypothetical protein [Aerosakkonema funiforme FACHB-1375]MBD3558314.1 hypothetical protein [Planktothrix sp. FACHB-1355]
MQRYAPSAFKALSRNRLEHYRVAAGVSKIPAGHSFKPAQVQMMDELFIAIRSDILTLKGFGEQITTPGWTLDGWLCQHWKMTLLNFLNSPRNKLGADHIVTIQTIYRLQMEQKSNGDNTRNCA